MVSASAYALDKSHRSKHYQILDIIRLLCACLVVLIHCLEVKEGHPIAYGIVLCFASQCVPFFFIVSGFFFAKKINNSNNQIKDTFKCAKGYLFLYFAWMIIELPGVIHFYFNAYNGKSFVYIVAVIVRRLFVAGQGVYWYILVLTEAIFVCGLLIKFKKEKLMYILAAIGLILGYIYDIGIQQGFWGQFNNLIYFLFSWSNNLLMKGLPYVALGVFMSRYEKRENLNRTTLVMVYSALSLTAVLIYVTCYPYNIDAVKIINHVPFQAVLLFLIAIQPSEVVIKKEITDHCRNLSTTIYFVHTIVIYQVIDRLWTIYSPVLLRFLVAVTLSTGVYCVAKVWKFKPLLWLLAIKN